MDYKNLVKRAKLAMKSSYSPYSRFKVGAAVLTQDGTIFSGCNIENSSFSLTLCAERTALFKAISDGATRFKALAIVSDATDFLPPCGACRQVLMELAPGANIILTNSKGRTKELTTSALLPVPFTQKFLLMEQ